MNPRQELRPWLVPLALALAGCAGHAVEPGPVAPTPAAPKARRPAAAYDAVILQDGTRVEGRVVRQEPGKPLVFETKDGKSRTIDRELIVDVILRGKDEEPPAEPAAREKPAARREKPKVEEETGEEVSFKPASSGDVYTVTVDEKSCTAPCSLRLATGSHSLKVTGAATYTQDITVSGPGTFTINQSCPGCVVAGVLGLPIMAGGIVFLTQTLVASGKCSDTYGESKSACTDAFIIPLVFSPLAIVLGTVMTAAGFGSVGSNQANFSAGTAALRPRWQFGGNLTRDTGWLTARLTF